MQCRLSALLRRDRDIEGARVARWIETVQIGLANGFFRDEQGSGLADLPAAIWIGKPSSELPRQLA
jgi:hypothetical protein